MEELAGGSWGQNVNLGTRVPNGMLETRREDDNKISGGIQSGGLEVMPVNKLMDREGKGDSCLSKMGPTLAEERIFPKSFQEAFCVGDISRFWCTVGRIGIKEFEEM